MQSQGPYTHKHTLTHTHNKQNTQRPSQRTICSESHYSHFPFCRWGLAPAEIKYLSCCINPHCCPAQTHKHAPSVLTLLLHTEFIILLGHSSDAAAGVCVQTDARTLECVCVWPWTVHKQTHTQKFSYCQQSAVVGSVSFNSVYVINNINHM